MPKSDHSRCGFALAFETSCATGEIALGRGHEVIETGRFSQPRAHAVEFLPAVDELCRRHGVAPSSIEHIYVSVGPGSFTGLRIAVTAARMMALAHGAQTVAVPTLDVIAQNAADVPAPPERVAVLLDAKRRRAYAAAFERGADSRRYVPTCDAAEVNPLAFLQATDLDCHVLGEGVLYHGDAVRTSRRAILDEALFPPRAETVYQLGVERAEQGGTVDPRLLTPVYIRLAEAEEKWRLLHGKSS